MCGKMTRTIGSRASSIDARSDKLMDASFFTVLELLPALDVESAALVSTENVTPGCDTSSWLSRSSGSEFEWTLYVAFPSLDSSGLSSDFVIWEFSWKLWKERSSRRPYHSKGIFVVNKPNGSEIHEGSIRIPSSDFCRSSGHSKGTIERSFRAEFTRRFIPLVLRNRQRSLLATQHETRFLYPS